MAGRGELQLGILIENMRREGFELTVSRPQVVLQDRSGDRQRLEPIEEVIIDVDEGYTGVVVQKLSERTRRAAGDAALRRRAPAPGVPRADARPDRLSGELLSDTRGTAVMNRLFHAYAPFKGEIAGRRTGVLISNSRGRGCRLRDLQSAGPRADDDRPADARL